MTGQYDPYYTTNPWWADILIVVGMLFVLSLFALAYVVIGYEQKSETIRQLNRQDRVKAAGFAIAGVFAGGCSIGLMVIVIIYFAIADMFGHPEDTIKMFSPQGVITFFLLYPLLGVLCGLFFYKCKLEEYEHTPSPTI